MTKSAGAERRRAKRRQILDAFSVFITIPRKGGYQLPVHDISDLGIGFDFDTEGESAADSPVKKGEKLELHLYLNRTISLPLSVSVARVEELKAVRRIGAEFNETGSPAFAAFKAFLSLVDRLTEMPAITNS